MKTRRFNRFISAPVFVLRGIAFYAVPLACVHADNATWNGTTNATWNADNWSVASVPGTGDTATFNNAGNGNTTLDLGAGVTVNSILFDAGAAAYILGSGAVGSQTLTLDSAGSLTQSSAADQLINANIVLSGATTINNTSANNLTLAAGVSGNGGSLLKLGTGTLTLAGLSGTAANNYDGTTTIDQGTIVLGQDSAFTGGLTFGATVASTNVGSLDLSNASATFGGNLLVQTDSASANTITIGSGQTLTTNGDVIIGNTTGAGNPNAKLTVAGAGTWTVTKSNGTFRVGQNNSGAARPTNGVLDLSGLASFTVDMRTTGLATGGSFQVGDASGGANGTEQIATLADISVIKAGNIRVTGEGQPNFNTLNLGAVSTLFQTETLTVGGSKRADDKLQFSSATGTFKLRSGNGSDRAGVNLGNNNTNSSGPRTAIIDLTGHSSDLNIKTMAITNIGTSNSTNSNHVATFSFDSGILDATTIRAGAKASGSSTGSTGIYTANLNLGSTSNLANNSIIGTLDIANQSDDIGTIVGNVNIAGNATTVDITDISIATSSNGGNATGVVNISGGAVAVTNGITLANRTGAGAVNGSLNITGGSLAVGGNITTTGIGGANTTLTLNGGSLDMAGNSIGTTGQLVTNLNFQSGTLSNVGGINDGAGLTKTTGGTLILAGTNTYTGTTSITAGTLAVTGSLGNSAVTVSNAATILATDAAASFGSTITIDGGAILAPGGAAAAGIATVTGATIFHDGSIFNWDIDAAGTSYDKLISSSLMDGGEDGGAVLRIVASDALVTQNFWNTTKTWTDIFTDGTDPIDGWDAIFTSFSVVDSSFDAIATSEYGSFSVIGSTLTWTAVPEPTSALAGLLIGCGMLRRRRN